MSTPSARNPSNERKLFRMGQPPHFMMMLRKELYFWILCIVWAGLQEETMEFPLV
jgi:hypothetical protein